MRVTVLYGGSSAEREISLISGQAVAAGLREAGHLVVEADIQPDDLSILDRPCDVVFPVLHGEWGESGELQEILEMRRLPFVGSGSLASRLGMDKVATKHAWERAGLPTPPSQVVTSLDDPVPDPPCVVKAVDSGSSIDVFICNCTEKASTNVKDAVTQVLSRHGRAMVEQYVCGPELTVGLLHEQPLAPIRIVPKSEFFDFQAKYRSADTEHRFDTGLPPDLVDHCRHLAWRANAIVGACDLARVDIMIDAATHRPYLLEINTLPGFTPKSLLPEAAKHAGIEFTNLVDRLARRAAARGPRSVLRKLPGAA